MPLKTFTKVFAITDAKIAALLTDEEGSAATYGPLIDVPGIKSFTITGSVESKTLRGDNTLLDSDAVISEVAVSIEYAKLSLPILAAVMSGEVTQTGVTPSQIAGWQLTNTSKPMPFRLVGKSASADTIGGDVLYELPKVVISSFPELGFAEEDYKLMTLEGNAMPLLSTGLWIDAQIRETSAVLA